MKLTNYLKAFYFVFLGCSSSKTPHFTVSNIKVKKTNAKTIISFEITNKENIVLENLYYNNQIIPIKKQGAKVVGEFTNKQKVFTDIQLHSNPKKEFNNTINSPLNSKNNNLLISYKKGKETIFKTIELKKNK